MMAALDAQFMEEECDKIDEAVTAFWNLRPEYGQTMNTYISNMHQVKMRMKKA